MKSMKITALAGGVGGARLANGLSKLLEPGNFSVIVNTGDDFFYSGLYICPDLDTVTYTLAGISDPVNGWGIADDSWHVLTALEQIGHPVWFRLGDRDLATHIERTRLLQSGVLLSEVTAAISQRLGVQHTILPMTNTSVRTLVETDELGILSFQEYFVKHKFQPTVRSIQFAGIREAAIPPSVTNALESADLIVICPSNPFVSIDPILSIPGMRNLVRQKNVIAVSPLIGGKALKGPAAKLMQEMNLEPSACNIAKHYGDLLNGFVLDQMDMEDAEPIRQCGIIPLESDILMTGMEGQARLAREVIEFGETLL
jgi:LPPG:FO 2-phospho-L-lactate transferase